jgi:hypothetical protein
MLRFSKTGFALNAIRRNKNPSRKCKNTNAGSARRSKLEPPSSKHNRKSLKRALRKEISKLRDELAAANDRNKTTLRDYNEQADRVEALTVQNTELGNALTNADERISELSEDLRDATDCERTSQGKLKAMEDRMCERGWADKSLAYLLTLFKESEMHLRSLELHIRQKVAENDLVITQPACVCPISRQLVRDPVQLPQPCKCTCVFERTMLEQLDPPGVCPTCRAKFSHEQVQPVHVLKNVIEHLVEQSVRNNSQHSLETLVSPPDAARMDGEPAVVRGW